MVADICGIDRGSAKTINLGLGYGMGGAKLARSLGLPTEWMWVRRVGVRNIWVKVEESEVPGLRAQGYDCVEVAGPEAQAIIKKWEQGAPFLRGLYDLCEEAASVRGYVKTILGRRCRFAMDGTGGHSWTHKSMNRLCQGSAADQTKRGMINVWDAGYCPSVSLHDELLFSVPDREYAQRFVPLMEEAVQLVVPSVIDIKYGRTWGDIPK
jgi:DNA polymerase I-like protein with 3'-5' exonuclease and polymerase domains